MADSEHRRDAMVDYQLAARGVSDPSVLNAMRVMPREHFVPAQRFVPPAARAFIDMATSDGPPT